MISTSYPAPRTPSSILTDRSTHLEIKERRTHLGITILWSVPVAAGAATGRRSLRSGGWSRC